MDNTNGRAISGGGYSVTGTTDADHHQKMMMFGFLCSCACSSAAIFGLAVCVENDFFFFCQHPHQERAEGKKEKAYISL